MSPLESAAAWATIVAALVVVGGVVSIVAMMYQQVKTMQTAVEKLDQKINEVDRKHGDRLDRHVEVYHL